MSEIILVCSICGNPLVKDRVRSNLHFSTNTKNKTIKYIKPCGECNKRFLNSLRLLIKSVDTTEKFMEDIKDINGAKK